MSLSLKTAASRFLRVHCRACDRYTTKVIQAAKSWDGESVKADVTGCLCNVTYSVTVGRHDLEEAAQMGDCILLNVGKPSVAMGKINGATPANNSPTKQQPTQSKPTPSLKPTPKRTFDL